MSGYGKFPKKWNDKFQRWDDARMLDTDCSKDVPLTTQADARELDINHIMARAQKGLGVPVFRGEAFYGDVSDLGGLQDAMIKVREANDLFMQYPADLRERFHNDAREFVAFFDDPKNIPEAIKLGLVEKRPDGDKPVPPVAPPASPEPGK